jgi:hypothetical protein
MEILAVLKERFFSKEGVAEAHAETQAEEKAE